MGKVLSAQGSGYFPICIPEGTPTPPKNFLSLTLQQAMSLFWRVKTWEAKITGTVSANTGISITYLLTNYQELSGSPQINSEENYVCKGVEAFSFGRVIEVLLDFGGGDQVISDYAWSFLYNFNPEGGFGAYRNGNIFYPSFETQLPGPVVSYDAPTYNTNVGIYQISLNGFTISGDLYAADDLAPSGTALIEIRAKEYWSYGGTYSTTTGESL
jgi:hypothetical protein